MQVAASHRDELAWTDRANMKATKMKDSSLPQESRHVNKKTITADWHAEYPTEAPAAPPAPKSAAARQSVGLTLGLSVVAVLLTLKLC